MSEDFEVDDEGCGTDESLAAADATDVERTARGVVTMGEGDAASDVSELTSAAAGDGGGDAGGLLDAVRVEVRPGEIVITIRADALVPTPPRVPVRGAGPMVFARTAAVTPPALAPRARGAVPAPVGAAPRAAAAPVFVGLATVPADKLGSGYNSFVMRRDLTDSYLAAYREVKALGGVLTSSGGIRDLGAGAGPGRAKTSLHYTGRAIDLFIYSGMQGGAEPYLVTRDGGTDANPEWKLYCVSTAPRVDDPLYDPSVVEEGELDCVRWQRNVGLRTVRRRARYFCLTDVLAKHGWQRIPARSDWRTQYLSCEWWHFQNPQGLVVGESTFGEQLLEVWPAARVRASGLALNARWAGRSFRTGQPAAPPAVSTAPQPDPAEKVIWAQTVLNATGDGTLAVDGRLAARTTAALQRFQARNGLRASGALDASTEVALLQAALELIAGDSFPRIGVLDEGTVAAVMRFQRAAGLTVDGRAGLKTRAAMVRALEPAAPVPAVRAVAPVVADAPPPRAASSRRSGGAPREDGGQSERARRPRRRGRASRTEDSQADELRP